MFLVAFCASVASWPRGRLVEDMLSWHYWKPLPFIAALYLFCPMQRLDGTGQCRWVRFQPQRMRQEGCMCCALPPWTSPERGAIREQQAGQEVDPDSSRLPVSPRSRRRRMEASVRTSPHLTGEGMAQ